MTNVPRASAGREARDYGSGWVAFAGAYLLVARGDLGRPVIRRRDLGRAAGELAGSQQLQRTPVSTVVLAVPTRAPPVCCTAA
jgi:hypothetical protein